MNLRDWRNYFGHNLGFTISDLRWGCEWWTTNMKITSFQSNSWAGLIFSSSDLFSSSGRSGEFERLEKLFRTQPRVYNFRFKIKMWTMNNKIENYNLGFTISDLRWRCEWWTTKLKITSFEINSWVGLVPVEWSEWEERKERKTRKVAGFVPV